MIPKVNKFDFYSYEVVGGKTVQLVGESNDKFEPNFLSKNQIQEIQKRVKLCEILTSVEFRIDSYGLVNFLVEHDDELENFKYLKELLVEFNDFQSIRYIEECFQFLEENSQEIENLKSNPENYESIIDILEEQIYFNNTLFQTTSLIDNAIRKNPSNFCYDELENPIDPLFCGNLKRFYPNGNIKHEYNFSNGRVHGEGLDFDFNGNKQRLILFENGRKVRILKKWDKDGNEK